MKSKYLAKRLVSLLLAAMLLVGMTAIPTSALDGTDEEFRALAYVTVPASKNWRWIGYDGPDSDDAVSGLDVRYVTHINFAFGMIEAYQFDPAKYGRPLQSGAVASQQAYLDPSDGKYHYKVTLEGWIEEMNSLVDGREYLRALSDLKEQKADLKVLLSVGGWDSDGFCYMAKTAAGRAEFIDSCIDLMYEYNLDGIDLDWEFPYNGGWGAIASCSSCSNDGNLLLQEMRAAFDAEWPDEHKMVTIASNGNTNWVTQKTFDCMDFINVMCYDYSPGSGGQQAAFSWCQSSMNNYASLFGGTPEVKKKLNLGIPFYNEGGAHLVPYCQDINWSGTVDCSPEITEQKMQWIADNDFGGGFYWNYSMDLFEEDVEKYGLDSSQEKILQKTVYITLNGEPSEPVGAATSNVDVHWARSDSKKLSGAYTYPNIISALGVTNADTALGGGELASDVLALYNATAKDGTVRYDEGYTFDGGYGGYEDDSVKYIQIGADSQMGEAVTLEQSITITGPRGNTGAWLAGDSNSGGFGSGTNVKTITQSGRYVYGVGTGSIWWFQANATYTTGSGGAYIFVVDVGSDGSVTVYDGSITNDGTPVTIRNTSYCSIKQNSTTSYTLSYSSSQGGNTGVTMGGFSSGVELSLDPAFDGTLEKVVRSSQSQYPGTTATAEYTYIISSGATPVSWKVVNKATGREDNGNIVIFDSATGKVTANGTGTVVITGTDSTGKSGSVTLSSNVSSYDGVYLTPDPKYSRYTSILGYDTEKGRWASFEANSVTRLSGFFYLEPTAFATAESFTLATKQFDEIFGGAGDYYIYVNGLPFIHASSQKGAVSFSGFANNLTIAQNATASEYQRYSHLNGMATELNDYQTAFASLLKSGANQIDIIASTSNETAIVRPFVYMTAGDGSSEIILAESIAVSPSEIFVEVDEQVTLSATISPSNAQNTTVFWSSSDNAIASVDQNGVVTALAAGSAVITASTSNGKTATCAVTVTKTEEPEPEPAAIDAFIFKVGNVNAYWATYDYQFTTLVACSFRDGVTYVPFRDIATAAGAKDIKFDADAATVTITNSYDMTFTLTMGETDCTYTYDGQTFESSLNYAPKYIDSVCCLPVRDVANITFASVAYEEVDGEGYVFVSPEALTADEITTLVDVYENIDK